MGVYYLNDFVRVAGKQSSIYEKQDLSGNKILIDANNLLHVFSHSSSKNNAVCGGDYNLFAAILTEFYKGLKQAEITPYFIFDGASIAGNMRGRQKKAKDKLSSLTRMIQGNSMTHFRHCLDLQVQLVYPLIYII